MAAKYCCVCLFKDGTEVTGKTMVKGYLVCTKHLSYQEDFFRDWESVQDPKNQPKTKK
ncbi:hypothetical protein QMK19_03675 [Streptomyces sp. H10-C2]|uniref:hypothetical protein n=1 Tax=unclassified Streptomyces TaxID=2593676 RepID=UPI0024BAFFF8|nr:MULTISPECIES: hypothetical protein [unclassified Streptomyces]MDJ0342287.1 hypothetical protein [Streptomyces sp. PH10-H1]MDJ0368801.1 hypothetical protein [Streptomyces sp. H10-C2]